MDKKFKFVLKILTRLDTEKIAWLLLSQAIQAALSYGSMVFDYTRKNKAKFTYEVHNIYT